MLLVCLFVVVGAVASFFFFFFFFLQQLVAFILSSDRKIVGNCEVIINVDIGSDHRMARARVEINKTLMRLKNWKKPRKALQYDLRGLEKLSVPSE